MTRLPFDASRVAARKKSAAAAAPNQGPGIAIPGLGGERDSAVFSVSQVNALINHVLMTQLPETFLVRGEISNFRVYDRGHAFFTLKDAGAELPCVLWKDQLGRLKFRPKDGLGVVARGAVKLYEPQGKLQLYVETLSPEGTGALELAFRQLCEKLKAEGLFEAGRKRAIPKVPVKVVVITSRTGDVLHDVLTTAHRRFPGLHVMLFPARVQGPTAAGEIVNAIATVNAYNVQLIRQSRDREGATVEFTRTDAGANTPRSLPDGRGSDSWDIDAPIDLILLVRGGGSLEDLWPFNEEAVARAIVASAIPIATGIGHEPDTTIADLVSDLRGPTPTAVTELTIPDVAVLRRQVDAMCAVLTRDVLREIAAGQNAVRHAKGELQNAARGAVHEQQQTLHRLTQLLSRIEPKHAIAQGWRRLDEAQHTLARSLDVAHRRAVMRLNGLEARLLRASPVPKAAVHRDRLVRLQSAMASAMRSRIRQHRARVDAMESHLKAIGPAAVLARGYTITTNSSGEILRSKSQVGKGDTIVTHLPDGTVKSTVGEPRQAKLF